MKKISFPGICLVVLGIASVIVYPAPTLFLVVVASIMNLHNLLEDFTEEDLSSLLSKFKSEKIKNTIRCIYNKYQDYRKQDKYIVNISCKHGALASLWFDSKEEAQKTIDWCLNISKDSLDTKIMSFSVSKNKTIKISKDNIEAVEHKKYSLCQRKVSVPIMALLKQNLSIAISFSKMIILFLLCLVAAIGMEHYKGVSLLEPKSFHIGQQIISNTYSIFIFFTFILTIIFILTAGLSWRSSIDKYYSNMLYFTKNSALNSMVVLIITVVLVDEGYRPIMNYALKIAQSFGLFLY